MFEIHMDNNVVGNATIYQTGLYYHIHCTCNPPSNEMYRIIMYNDSACVDLGICVPDGDVFTLFTRISAKSFRGDNFKFKMVRGVKGEYVVLANTPFEHLSRLETARLQKINGQLWIVTDSVPVPQDSGQSQEHPNK